MVVRAGIEHMARRVVGDAHQRIVGVGVELVAQRSALASACVVTQEYANFPILAARCAPGAVKGLRALPGVVFVEIFTRSAPLTMKIWLA